MPNTPRSNTPEPALRPDAARALAASKGVETVDARRPRRAHTVTVLAELIHEAGDRPWERSCVIAADLYDAMNGRQRAILEQLAISPATVMDKARLVAGSRGRIVNTRELDSSAAALRQNIVHHSGARLVCNVWGVGYRLMDAAAAEIQP